MLSDMTIEIQSWVSALTKTGTRAPDSAPFQHIFYLVVQASYRIVISDDSIGISIGIESSTVGEGEREEFSSYAHVSNVLSLT